MVEALSLWYERKMQPKNTIQLIANMILMIIVIPLYFNLHHEIGILSSKVVNLLCYFII